MLCVKWDLRVFTKSDLVLLPFLPPFFTLPPGLHSIFIVRLCRRLAKALKPVFITAPTCICLLHNSMHQVPFFELRELHLPGKKKTHSRSHMHARIRKDPCDISRLLGLDPHDHYHRKREVKRGDQ